MSKSTEIHEITKPRLKRLRSACVSRGEMLFDQMQTVFAGMPGAAQEQALSEMEGAIEVWRGKRSPAAALAAMSDDAQTPDSTVVDQLCATISSSSSTQST